MFLEGLILRPLEAQDVVSVVEAFAALGWQKPAEQYEKYLAEQESGKRQTVFEFVNGIFAGYLNVLWESHYAPFVAEQIPKINDFNVLPAFRRQGVGSCLMDEAERIIATRSPSAGIGVGMDTDMGPRSDYMCCAATFLMDADSPQADDT